MNIAFIGYGEVGSEMSKGLSNYKVEHISVYDPLVTNFKTEHLSGSTNITFYASIEQCFHMKVDIVFVAVPANKTSEVWDVIYKTNIDQTILVDLTTASAEEKQLINEKMNRKDKTIIDGAILGALKVYQNTVPIIASGKEVATFEKIAEQIGMNVTKLSERVGDATNFKFIRSIYTKGLTTLLYEVMETAEKSGLENEIFESISETMNKDSFEEILNRYIKSNVKHSKRREVEMGHVIDFMDSNGIEPHMTKGTKAKLEKITNAKLNEKLNNDDFSWKQVIKEYNKQ
ncbi:DUF1932 domain-containing protein [Mammaliicoccus vitulinus]|uniref:DUF1932 domain-containing protein n=1 Tax=Mammaliicoccus vitulinus TaxID=71237 RepID=UPI0002E05E5B|nr:DUF1932 domain-containing protein [Mammaliicoccus vitulinus]